MHRSTTPSLRSSNGQSSRLDSNAQAFLQHSHSLGLFLSRVPRLQQVWFFFLKDLRLLFDDALRLRCAHIHSFVDERGDSRFIERTDDIDQLGAVLGPAVEGRCNFIKYMRPTLGR